MSFKESLILLPKYFISRYFLMSSSMTLFWLYLRKNLPIKRPQKLSIIEKVIINLPLLTTLLFIAHGLYLILLEEENPFFTQFISIINLNKIGNYLPAPLLEIFFNNKYFKQKLDPDEIFQIYYMLSCFNAIKSLLITWYEKGNARLALFEVDYETSLLLYFNRSGPTLMIFFMRAFFSFIIFSLKVLELDKYFLLIVSFIYRYTDFYYFIYHIYTNGKGYPKILAIWRIMEFVLLFSIAVYFLFLFIKYFINDNLGEFIHAMKLRLKDFSLIDDCHTLLFKLAEQTLRNEGSNGYSFHVNAVSLPTSYYCYNYYKNNKLVKDQKLNSNINDTINDRQYFKIINDENYHFNNNTNIQKKIEDSNFKYQNWVNPDFNKYRKMYNACSYEILSEDEELKINKLNDYSNSHHHQMNKSKNEVPNNLFNVFRLHHFSSIIKNQILRRNNDYQGKENENSEEQDSNKMKKAHLFKKNWKSKINNKKKIKISKSNINTNSENTLNSMNNDDNNNNYNSKYIPSIHNANRKKHHPKIMEYNRFLYDTYEENEDDDLIEDPTYIYNESVSDTEESRNVISTPLTSSSSMTMTSPTPPPPKDTIYHELYDIMQDADVINGLKSQNIIDEHDANNQDANLDLELFNDDDIQGVMTRSKYHRLLLNTDDYSTAEGPSTQTQTDIDIDSTTSFKYQLPLRDALAKETAQYEIDHKADSASSSSHMDAHKLKWNPPILKKFNPFAHHDSSLEESSSSSSSGNDNAHYSNENASDVTNETTKDPYEFYRRTCVVCFDSQREIILWPCGCLCLCDDCREMMTFKAYKRCPCCQQEVTSYSKIDLK